MNIGGKSADHIEFYRLLIKTVSFDGDYHYLDNDDDVRLSTRGRSRSEQLPVGRRVR